jgi:hypothetical protein
VGDFHGFPKEDEVVLVQKAWGIVLVGKVIGRDRMEKTGMLGQRILKLVFKHSVKL